MKTQHTPGPWIVGPSSNPRNGSAWRDILSIGCEFSPSYVGEAHQQDAYLIAAAPDLLEALEAALSHIVIVQGENIGGVQEVARAAIAKAKGA